MKVQVRDLFHNTITWHFILPNISLVLTLMSHIVRKLLNFNITHLVFPGTIQKLQMKVKSFEYRNCDNIQHQQFCYSTEISRPMLCYATNKCPNLSNRHLTVVPGKGNMRSQTDYIDHRSS